jgi:hypothetical protein
MKLDQIAPQARILRDRDAILRELHEIVTSRHFCNSKRYPAMLEYLVKSTLAGKENLLKERTIGIEVFERPSTYDTNTDTVVRFTASEVRKRLSSYYHDEGCISDIRISLPAGSYVPEFLFKPGNQEEVAVNAAAVPVLSTKLGGLSDAGTDLLELLPVAPIASNSDPSDGVAVLASPPRANGRLASERIWGMAMAAIITLAVLAGVAWTLRPVPPLAATYDFWQTFLRGQQKVLVCTGTTTVSTENPDHLQDVGAASEISQYPLVSLQTASAISLVDFMIAGRGVVPILVPAATTPLSELRENAVVLVTAYANPWTLRFVDRDQHLVHWAHSSALPYANTDDYALIARFWNRDTDNWMVVLAGVGRNGTEAAAEFVASPKQMRRLRAYVGRDFSKGNLEVVLKVSVVDGKTGAPTIVAADLW